LHDAGHGTRLAQLDIAELDPIAVHGDREHDALVTDTAELTFSIIGLWVGEGLQELYWLARACAAAGVLATLATLPFWRLLVRLARYSTLVATLMIPVGLIGIYWLLPRVFVYVQF